MGNKNIGYRLVKIKTNSFETKYEGYDFSNLKNSFNITTNYHADDDTYSIGVNHVITFLQSEDSPFIKIDVLFVFELTKKTWDLFVADDKLVIPMEIAQVLNNISIGTSRGIIHTKTENTPFNNIILPPIVLDQLVDDDVSFVFSKSET